MADIAAGLKDLRRRIDTAAVAVGRAPGDATLVAVSKTQPAEAIEAALAAGQRVFGENRVQEALAKFPALRERHPDLELRLIGPLQTNKVKEAVRLFDVIETIDRPKLAAALHREMIAAGRRLRCLIQVNTGEEPQKAGVLPAEFDDLLRYCRDELGLVIDGLMCIPPAGEEPSVHFAFLRDLARRHGLAALSMGMSGDFELAVRLGATHVRVGTALFGTRPAAPAPVSE
jgi:pyridoxal phosphate enzyme (YggS family)